MRSRNAMYYNRDFDRITKKLRCNSHQNFGKTLGLQESSISVARNRKLKL